MGICKRFTATCFTAALAVLFATLCLIPAAANADQPEGENGEALVLDAANGAIPIDEAHFPDANFRSFVGGYDTDGDGALSGGEIAAVTEMDCQQRTISDLTGIEHFTDLKFLNCSYNPLGSLDVSKNVNLTDLHCVRNQLTSLDVSSNVNLQALWTDGNSLGSLDVSKNAKLTDLSCSYDALTSLDVSKNSDLASLSCDRNELTSLDVSKNANLKSLYCYRNNITSLDFGNDSNLEGVYCGDNKLATLDVSRCSTLHFLDCSENQLREVDVSKNAELYFLDCGINLLTSIDVSENSYLRSLFCYGNQLTEVDVRSNPRLYALNVHTNLLTSIDVGNNPDLTRLVCSNNPLTSLDLGNNPNIWWLGTDDCSRLIGVDGARSFDLAQLPGFDASKASEWSGGTVDGTVLTVADDVDAVTYEYDCGNGNIVAFTLNVGYAVSFDTAGGSAVETQTVAKGDVVAKPASEPTKDKNTFAGWYADAACTQAYDFDAPVTKAATIYAKWTPVEDEGGDGDEGGQGGGDEGEGGGGGQGGQPDGNEGEGENRGGQPDGKNGTHEDADEAKASADATPQTGEQATWPLVVGAAVAGSLAALLASAAFRMGRRNG